MLFLSKAWSWCKTYAPGIFVMIGLVLLTTFWSLDDKVLSEKSFEILKASATALLSGGVFAAVLKSLQFSNVFGEELEKIIYNQKFLSDQKGIANIWKRVTNALHSDSVTKEIGKSTHPIVLEHYIPNHIDFYYDQLKYHFDFSWEDKAHGLLKVVWESDLIIRAKTTDKIELAPTYTRIIGAVPNEEKSDKFYGIEGRGRNRTDTLIQPEEVEMPELNKKDGYEREAKKFMITLQGKTKYIIKRKVEHLQNIKKDPVYLIRTFKFCKSLELKVNKPHDLNVKWESCGLLDDLDLSNGHSPNNIALNYQDIIFPNQGFVLVFH